MLVREEMKEEVGWLIDTIEESEYISSYYINNNKTLVALAHVIADIQSYFRPLPT
jgi:hypothetical protein